MTVADLRQKLATLPDAAVVVFQQYSECVEMGDDDVSVEPMILRHGTYMRFDSRFWDHAADGEPRFIDCCRFPGN